VRSTFCRLLLSSLSGGIVRDRFRFRRRIGGDRVTRDLSSDPTEVREIEGEQEAADEAVAAASE